MRGTQVSTSHPSAPARILSRTHDAHRAIPPPRPPPCCADYARRDPLVPGLLPGCQPLPPQPPHAIASMLPVPQANIITFQTRHELRQALGPTFSHMAEAQLMKMLRALGTGDRERQTEREQERQREMVVEGERERRRNRFKVRGIGRQSEGKGQKDQEGIMRTAGEDAGAGAGPGKTRDGKLTLENMIEAFGVWGVTDLGLLRRFWSHLSQASSGEDELDLWFVMEEVRTMISLAARTKLDDASALRQWKESKIRLMDGAPTRRTVSGWSYLQVSFALGLACLQVSFATCAYLLLVKAQV